MKSLLALIALLAPMVQAQTTNAPDEYVPHNEVSVFFYCVTNSSGVAPLGMRLFNEDVGYLAGTYTNGPFVYENLKRIPYLRTNLVAIGNIVVTNVTMQEQVLDEFLIGTRRFEKKDDNLFVSGTDFVQLVPTYIMVREQPTTNTTGYLPPNLLDAPEEVFAERGQSLREYRANTNLFTARELEAKGVKIMFREVLSIELVPVDEKILRTLVIRRWMPCSEPLGKPVAELMGL